MFPRLGARYMPATSIRLRLTLWYTLVLAATVASLGAALYFLLARTLAAAADQDVATTTATIARAIDTRADDVSGQIQVLVPGVTFLGDADTYVQIVDMRSGQVLARSANLGQLQLPPPPQPLPSTERQSGGAYHTVEDARGRLRIFSRPVFVDGQAIAIVQAAHSLSADDRLLDRLRLLLAIVGGLGLPATAIIGWGLAGRALAPIGDMTRTAERIGAARDFSQRVTHHGPADELDHLARTLNVMLAELQASHLELGNANARLADANSHLEQALAVQKRFVADASHELRTPLTTIRANAEVLRWTSSGTTTTEQDLALEDLVGEAGRMSRLVEGLLTLARADSGHAMPLQAILLRPIVEDAYRATQHLARGQQLELTIATEATVRGTPDMLRQLLLILFDNALKYSPPGERVTVEVRQANDDVRLSVTDTGIGIAPDDLSRIFEPFYRADSARETDGSGLGLAIARSIVHKLGGQIDVVSGLGRGSSFTVVLPAVVGPPAQAERQPAVAHVGRRAT